MNILVLGAYGFLGKNLSSHLEKYGHKVYRQGRIEGSQIKINPLIVSDLRSHILALRLDVIINLIAETNVDYCEENYLGVFEVNALISAHLEEIRKYSDFKIIHISTDQVYSGKGPHVESIVNPVNFYGLSKYCGECFLDKNKSIIIRTNFFGFSDTIKHKNFTLKFINSLKKGQPMHLFSDVWFNPIYIETLSMLICEKILHSEITGVFNIGSHEPLDKYSFYSNIAKLLDLDTNLIKKINISDLKLRARRPKDMTMNISKFQDSFLIKLPKLNEEILKFTKDYLINVNV